MCIIIDTNVLVSVFDNRSANHQEFLPVFDWIREGKGKIVYGGTKYFGEMGKYIAIFSELRKAKKAIYIDNDKVDAQEKIASSKLQHKDFDDQHLVGLLIESKCKLICSLDERAYQFFTSSKFFSPSSQKPKIYSNKTNRKILKDNNIAEVCKPCLASTKAQKKIFDKLNSN
ncbi:PIN domain-containing protein [Flavobacterium anhuiense]|uniref:PIN domain-containing protein n=1 Tax=Flavobacterium anhuiense TaxID=459526 RepID=UPI003D965400